MCVCVCIHIYIYIYTGRPPHQEALRAPHDAPGGRDPRPARLGREGPATTM